MKFAFDTEFIDTPTASELISIGIVSEDNREFYREVQYNESNLTPWLRQNVVNLLSGDQTPIAVVAQEIREFVGGSKFNQPEFWAYYASHDWYWMCRSFGGMMEMPAHWPHAARDFLFYQNGVPDLFGPPHHALNDAKSLLFAMRTLGLAPIP